LTRTYGGRRVPDLDDAFNARLAHAKAVLEGLAREGHPRAVETPNGIRGPLGRRVHPLVRRSGGYQVGFGLESADPGVLRANGKNQDMDAALAAIRAFEAAGISTFGSSFSLAGRRAKSPAPDERATRVVRAESCHCSLAVPIIRGRPSMRGFQAQGKLGTDWENYRHTRGVPDLQSELRGLALVRSVLLSALSTPRRGAPRVSRGEPAALVPVAFARAGWAYCSNTAGAT